MKLREVGADQFLLFREKPHAFCETHYREHAKELGIAVAMDKGLGKRVVEELASGVSIDVVARDEDRVFYFVTHGFEEVGTLVEGSAGEPPPDTKEIARLLYTTHCLTTIGDHALARDTASPLAAFADRLVRFKTSGQYGDAVDEVALNLRLPVLEGLTAAELIRVREKNRDEFVQFRSGVTEAIRAQLAAAGSESPSKIATRVIRDYVDPEVARIGVELKSARKTLARKVGVNAAVATVGITVGVMSGMPLALSSTVAVASSVAHAKKYIDQKADIELSDAYFLWRLRKRHGE